MKSSTRTSAAALAAFVVVMACVASQTAAQSLVTYENCWDMNDDFAVTFCWNFKPGEGIIEIGASANSINGAGNTGVLVIGIIPADDERIHAPTNTPGWFMDAWTGGFANSGICNGGCILDQFVGPNPSDCGPGANFCPETTVDNSSFLTYVDTWVDDGLFGWDAVRPLDIPPWAENESHDIPVDGDIRVFYMCRGDKSFFNDGKVYRHAKDGNVPICAGSAVMNFANGPPEVAKVKKSKNNEGGTFENDDGSYTINWNFNEDGDGFVFTITAATTGWVAFGWNNDNAQAHIDADMYVGWVDDDGSVTVLDMYSTSNAAPIEDKSQDLIDIEGSEEGGATIITFSRLIDTGDSDDDQPILDQEITLQWAFGLDDGPGIEKHETPNRGIAAGFNWYELGPRRKGIYDYVNAGSGHVILCFIFIFIYIVVRYVHMLYKWCSGGGGDDDDDTVHDDMFAVDSGGKGEAGTAYNVDEDGDPGGDPPESYRAARSNTKAKPPTGSCGIFIHSLKEKRILETQITQYDAIIGFFYFFLNLGWGFIWASPAWGYGNSLGYLCAANGLLVLLPATRNSFLIWLLGFPFDRTIMFHRWLGRWTLFLGFVHMFVFWGTWANQKLSLFGTMFGSIKYIYGLLALLCMVWIIITAYSYFRRRMFNFFYYSHFIFLAFYGFAWAHSPAGFGPFGIAACVFYGIDRLLRLFWGAWPQETIKLQSKGDGDVTQVQFPKHPFASYKCGQYAFINFPGISLLQWHPFTLSSGPREPFCEMHIKNLGDYTERLQEVAADKTQLYCRIDGPYGHLSLNYKRYPVLVLTSGGIGVTPMIAMLKEIYNYNADDSSNHSPAVHASHCYFLWVVPNEGVYEWFREEIEGCMANGRRPGFPKLTLLIYVTRAKELSNDDLVMGRPDVSKIFDRIQEETQCKRVACYACGPARLVNGVWDESVRRSVDGCRIDFHHETFEF